MTSLYMPILKAKRGEFTAMSNLDSAVADQCWPVFEIPPTLSQEGKKKQSLTPIRDGLDRAANGIASVRAGRNAAIDISAWPPNSRLESGEHVINYLVKALNKSGVMAWVVVGFDRWDDADYQAAFATLSLKPGCGFIIRFDKTSIDDTKDTGYLEDQLASISETCGADARFGVMLDFGDLRAIPVVDLQVQAADTLSRLAPWSFEFKAIVGASLPAIINDAVDEVDSQDLVLRREIVAWKTLRQTTLGSDLKFGDYGVRNPRSHDGIVKHANGKVRYTTGHNFFVARGHSLKLGNKYGQFHDLASVVASSSHFKGAAYSWGDAKIASCSAGESIRSPQTWISIDTNHHLTSVVEDLSLFVAAPVQTSSAKSLA